MAKRISEKDIFQGDIFAKSRKSAQDYIGILKTVEKELKSMLEINKQILKQSSQELKTTEAIKKRATAINEVRKSSKALGTAEQERIKTERELLRLEQEKQKVKQATNRTAVQERKEQERLQKIKQKNLKIAKQENSAYSKQSKKLNELRKRYKDLAVQNKQNTKEGQRLLKTIQKLDGRLKKVDKSVGQSQRNVGNYTSAWGKLGMRLKSVAGAFGLMGGVMGAVSLIRNSFNVIRDFDQSIANLGAISGKTAQEIKPLRDQAMKLGEATRFTATEIVGLQIELAKLGFSIPEIQDSTEAISNLSAATGSELADSAKIAGSVLRAFNLDASEMNRVAGVLGVSTTKSALNMEFLQTAMAKVAPVASAMGFSLEDTTALLGTLANSGFDASTAATSTRNILLNLADSSGDLAQALGRPVENLDDLIPALRELQEKGIDVAEALELTDKRSVAAFKTFLEGTGTLTKLRGGLNDVERELAAMSEKQLDTINGQLALLNSKWQGMILGTSESTDAVNRMKGAIKFLTDNLELIINTIINVVKYLVIFKLTQFAVNSAMRIGRALNIAYRISVIAMSRGFRSATRSIKVFNTALKSNPIGLLISGLVTAIAFLWDFIGATDESSEAVDTLTEAFEKLQVAQRKAFKDIDASSSQTLANIDLEIAKQKQKGATEKELQGLREKRLDEEIKILTAKQTLAESNLEIMKDEGHQIARNKTDYERRLASEKKKIALMSKGVSNVTFYEDKVAKLKADIIEGETARATQDELIADIKTQITLKNTQVETSKINLDISINNLKTTKATTKVLRDINIYERERNKLLKEREALAESLRSEDLKNELVLLQERIDKEYELRIAESEDEDFVMRGGFLRFADLKKYEEMLGKKQDLENKQIKESTAFKIAQAEKDQASYLLTIKKAYDSGKLLQDEANVLIFASEEKLIDDIDLLRIKENEKYRLIQQDKVNETQKANDEILETTGETISSMEKGEIDSSDKLEDKENAILVQRLQAYKEFTNQIIQLINKQTDAKIKAIDDELSVSEKREDELRQLAIKGTTTANQSLAAEQKRQAELERQKEELEKKKIRRQAILSGLDLLTQKLEDDDADAVTSTIRDMTKLVALLSNLPGFAEGSEYIQRGDSPKGKDTIVARINEGERILTTAQNKQIGDLSNEQLTALAKDYNNGIFQDVNYMKPQLKDLNQPYQSNQAILSKFDELKRTIEQKPMLTEIRWDEISEMIIEKVETKNKITNKHTSSKRIF